MEKMFAGGLSRARADPLVLGRGDGQGSTGQDKQAGKPPPESQQAKPGDCPAECWQQSSGNCLQCLLLNHHLNASWSTRRTHRKSACFQRSSKLARGEFHCLSCAIQELARRNLYWNQEGKPLPPAMSLSRPLLTKLNFVSKEEMFQNCKQGNQR